MSADPPFIDHCGAFLSGSLSLSKSNAGGKHQVQGESDLPLIDMSSLWDEAGKERDRKACVAALARASSEWGFFQVVNHGINHELFCEMTREQKKVFKLPFENKTALGGTLAKYYRWGAPSATCIHQFSWSESFHVPISMISDENRNNMSCGCHDYGFWDVMERFATAMSKVAQKLAGVLAENMGRSGHFLAENWSKETCFLRLNRYPACPISQDIFGLMPHTDSDFLTVLWQDQVGGLQLMKDSNWVTVRPNPDALVVNIGDLFQAWSNDMYTSVEHKVMTNSEMERYSIAYFLCPSYDSIIGCCKGTSLYKKFTFGEYRKQVQDDVKESGNKAGLDRFLL